MIRLKVNVLEKLKEAGYTTGRIRIEHVMGEQMLQKIRTGELPSWKTLDNICRLLNCQPGDLLEHVPDEDH